VYIKTNLALYKRGSTILNIILSLILLIPLLFTLFHIQTYLKIDNAIITISLSLLMSLIAYFITYRMIPTFMKLNKEKEIFGVDINKVEDIKNKDDPNRREV
jgi:hypothetical protein